MALTRSQRRARRNATILHVTGANNRLSKRLRASLAADIRELVVDNLSNPMKAAQSSKGLASTLGAVQDYGMRPVGKARESLWQPIKSDSCSNARFGGSKRNEWRIKDEKTTETKWKVS